MANYPQYRLPYTVDTLKKPKALRDPIAADNLIPLYDIDYDGFRRYRYSQKANKTYTPPKNLVLDYNDPTQINSMADVILKAVNVNNPDFLNPFSLVKDTWNYFKDSTIEPIKERDFGAFGLNVLTNLGETLDVPANIVKGALFKKGTVKKALGYYDEDGNFRRENYDIETGNLPLDILLEVAVDPMNWITFGQWAVAKTATKAGTTALKEAAGEVSQELSEKAYKKLVKKATYSYIDGDYDTMTDAVNGVLKGLTDHKKTIPKLFKSELTQDQAILVMKQMQDATVQYNSNIVLDSFKKFVKPIEEVDNFALKTALTGNGIYPAYKLLGKGLNTVTGAIKEKELKGYTQHLQDFTKLDGTVNIMKYDDVVSETTKYKNVIDVANKLSGDEALQSNILNYVIDKTVNKDLDNIIELYNKYADKPDVFNKELIKLLELDDTGEFALTRYIKQLDKINNTVGSTLGEYDSALAYLKELEETMDSKLKYLIDDRNHKLRTIKVDLYEQIRSEVTSFLNGFDLRNNYNQTINVFKDLFNKANLDIDFRIKNAKYLNEDEIINILTEEITEATQELFTSLAKYKDLPEGYEDIRDLLNEAVGLVVRYSEDLKNQLETTFRKSLVENLYNVEPSKAKFPDIDFNKLKLGGAFSEKIDKITEELRKLSTKPPELKGDMVSSSAKLLESTKKQGLTLDAIMKNTDSAQKNVKADFQIQPMDAAQINKVRTKLVEIFGEDASEFARTYNDLFDIAPELFRDMVNDFLYAEDTNQLIDAWYTLSRTLNRMTDGTLDKINRGVNKEHKFFKTPGKVEYAEKDLDYLLDKVNKFLKKVDGVSDDPKLKNAFESSKKILNTTSIDALYKNKELKKNIKYILNKGDDDTRLAALQLLNNISAIKPARVEKPKVYIVDKADNTKILADLGTVISDLDKLNPIKLADAMLTVETNAKIYQFKTEQVYNMLQLMNIESLSVLFKGMDRNEGFGSLVNTLASASIPETDPLYEVSKACKLIDYYKEHYTNYKLFLDLVANVQLDKEVKGSFISTLQKYANINPNDIITNPDYFLDKIFNDTDSFVNQRNHLPSLSLDTYRKDEEILEALSNIKEIKNMDAHTALYDTYTLEEVLKKEGIAEKYFNDPDKTYILFDTETFGLKANQGDMFEIAFKEFGKPGTQLNVALDPTNARQQPTNNLLNKFGYDKAEDFYKTRSGNIPTEKEMLQIFIDKLKEYKGNVVLIGHNSDQFDLDFIFQRMYNNGISSYDIEYLRRLTKYDSLNLLREKHGYKTLTVDSKYKLKKLLMDYAYKQQKAGVPKLIAPNSGGLADALNDVKNGIIDITKKKALGSEVSNIPISYADALMAGDIANDIYSVLRDIRANNKILGTHLIVPELFDDASDVHRKLVKNMSNFLGKEVDPKNMTQLLYGYLEDAVGTYGYKKIVDFDLLTSWFNFSPQDQINLKLAKSLTSLGKSFERTKDAIKNIDILQDKQAELNRVLNILLPKRLPDGVINLDNFTELGIPLQMVGDFYANIKGDISDTLSVFVVTQYMYNVYKNKGCLFESIRKAIGEETLKFLDDTSEVFNKAFNSRANYKLLEIDSDIASPEQLNKVVKEFQESVINPLVNLGELYEGDNLYRSKVLTVTENLKPTQNMLEIYNKRLTELSSDKKAQNLYIDSLKSYTNSLAEQQLYQVLNYTPENLFRHLVYNTPWIEFSTSDIKNNISLEKSYMKLFEKLDSYKELGITISEVADRTYIRLNKDVRASITYHYDSTSAKINNYINNVLIPEPMIEELNLEQASKYLNDPEMVGTLSDVRNSINNLSSNRSVGTLGDSITPTTIRNLYDQLPKEVQKDLQSIEKLTDNNLFQYTRYNHTNIGSITSRRVKQNSNSIIKQDVDDFTPRTIISIYKQNAENIASMSSTKIRYAQLYYGKEFSINNSVFFNSPGRDKEIIEAFKNNPEYVLTALVEDKKHGYKAIKIKPNSSEALAQARRLNAVVLPYHVAQKAAKVINQDMMSSYRKHWWNKLLYAYKVGYLLDPSVWLRNMLDSSLKTMGMTNKFTESLTTQVESATALKLYDKIVNDVMNLSQFDLNEIVKFGLEDVVEKAIKQEKAKETLTAMALKNKYDGIIDDIIRMDFEKKFKLENLKFYFDNMHPELDYETFNFIHNFLTEEASAGMTKTWTDNWGLKESKEGWAGFVNMSNKIMSPNGQVEQINRLAEYLILARHGDDTTKAFYKVVKTHFDYSDKAPWEIYAELIFPFYSFTMKNLEYWLDIVESNPSLVRQLENVMTPVSNFDEYDNRELQFNKSLQYQILAGSIPLTDSGMTLKASPSFMDVLNLITDPIGSAHSKITAPLQMLFDSAVQSTENQQLMDVLGVYRKKDAEGYAPSPEEIFYNSVPILGTFARKYLQQAQTYYDRTGNPLNYVAPGLFGATKRYELYEYTQRNYPKGRYPSTSKGYKNYNRKNYNNYNNSKFKKYNGNTRKLYTKKTYAKKTYAEKSYSTKSYSKHYYNSWIYPNTDYSSFYKKHYTKTGKSRLKQLMLPTNGQGLKYKIANTINYFR